MKEFKINGKFYIRTNDEPELNNIYQFIVDKMAKKQCIISNVNVKVLNAKEDCREEENDYNEVNEYG